MNEAALTNLSVLIGPGAVWLLVLASRAWRQRRVLVASSLWTAAWTAAVVV